MTSPLDPSAGEADIFRAFAMACRAERDRISLAGLTAEDHRFETAVAERAVAERFAMRLIGSLTEG